MPKRENIRKRQAEGIAVAEYWTQFPSKSEFERKINELYKEAQERLERRAMLPSGTIHREIEYFYDPKDD